MADKFSRRDFLKLASLTSAATFLPPRMVPATGNDLPNIIVLVFDAWSAANVSLYGYPRQTTPNLERLAENAIVYHNHHAGGYYTTPGTASLLTGVLPWRHQLYNQTQSLDNKYKTDNLFGLFPDYYRLAYSHNALAEEIFLEMTSSLNELKPREDLYFSPDPLAKVFRKDYDIASVSWIRSMETIEDGFANSTFLSRLWTKIAQIRESHLEETYPLGLPKFGGTNSFLLEEAIDWLALNAGKDQNPWLTYYHLLPPHKPYNTRIDFQHSFKGDGFQTPEKPEHFLTYGISYPEHQEARQLYDEYILFVDAEVKRLYDLFKSQGVLDNTWIILTSDHGEMFERGIHAHGKPSMHHPLVNIPLILFPPGRQERIDIHQPTSAIDILPTLLKITGKEIPEWLEGQALPPFDPVYPQNQDIFMVDGTDIQINAPLNNGSLMLRRGDYKLIVHFGTTGMYEELPGHESIELYNLKQDREEMHNLASERPDLITDLMEILHSKMKSEGIL